MEWISVKDRKPTKVTICCVTHEGEEDEFYIARYYPARNIWYWCHPGDTSPLEITHWIELTHPLSK